MAATLSAVSGRSLSFRMRAWSPGKASLLDTSGYTLTLFLRDAERLTRVVARVKEHIPPGTEATLLDCITPSTNPFTDLGLMTVYPVVRVQPGEWDVFFTSAVTLTFPRLLRFEGVISSDTYPELDRVPVAHGVIRVRPATALELA